MKALIICSVHALCDISALERAAVKRTCALHGIPADLSTTDHEHIVASTTILDMLIHLYGSVEQRQALVKDYIAILNDEVWTAAVLAHQSVFDTLLDPTAYRRPTGFVSDYPLLTTNLVRSAALHTNATKLGHITALSDPMNVQSSTAGLTASADSLGARHNDVEVIVAHQRDFNAALSLGMHPRFVPELKSVASLRKKRRKPRKRVSSAAVVQRVPIPQPVQISA